MFKVFIRLLLVVLLTTTFLSSDTKALFAQENDIKITRLSTEILPEYDTPDILVINAIQIQNNSDKDYSGDLRWVVPNDSKTHIVIDQNTSQNQLPFSLVQNNGNTEMVWKLSTPLKAGEIREIHLEYYYNNIQGNVDKTFSFDLIQPYPITFSQLYIYQPIKATNFKITPEMGPPQSQSGQFTYYQKSYSNLSPGQNISVSVSYTKSDPNPSVAPPNSPSGQNQAPNPNNNVPSPKGFDKNTGIYIIAGLAIVIVLLATKIISNNRRLAEMANYEMDYEESEDDFFDENDDDDDDSENRQITNQELTGEKAKLERNFKAGRITEEEYVLLLEELK